MWLHQNVYDYVVTLERFAGTPESDVAHFSTALESILCGVIFFFVVWRLSRELVPRSMGAHITCALLLLTQGFALLFFGYPENYTYQTVALGLYLLLSLRFLKGTCGIAGPTLALVISLGLHLSSLALLPSYAVLLLAGWLDHQRRRATVRDFGILVAAVAALIFVLGIRDETFSIQKLVTNILHEVTSGRGTGSGWSYLISARHFRDFLNEQFLIGPFALFFFLPALVFTIVRGRSARTALNGFLAAAGLSYFAGSWMTADPLLGYPRDWDVFAPSALVYASAALGLFFWRATDADDSPSQSEVHVHGALLSAVLVSLFCVLPWIALNASEARALERTKMLPMDFGRDEMVVARYYLNHGKLDEAERWFARSIGEFRYNVNSYHLLGTLYMRQGKSEKAVTAFQNAVAIRPDKLVLRKQLAVALIEAGQAFTAEPHLRVLAESSPTDLPIWRRYGLVLLEMGEIERARRALEHARTLYKTPAHAAQDLVTQCRALATKVANEGNLELARICGEFADSFAGSAGTR